MLPTPSGSPSLGALGDRAVAYLRQRGGAAALDELLASVYAARVPGPLQARLARPLLADPRIERRQDGTWALRPSGGAGGTLTTGTFTAVAIAATGPRPGRARLLALAAERVEDGATVARLSVLLNPERAVPAYVLRRARLDPELLDAAPPFARVAAKVVDFLSPGPLVAQEALHAWRFLAAEARRVGLRLPPLALVDLNETAATRLPSIGKPTLARIARALQLPPPREGEPRDEAATIARATVQLVSMGPVLPTAGDGETPSLPLRRLSTPRAAPSAPGVYLLKNEASEPLYVGQSRNLRERLSAYVSRPLGASRRLEGLGEAVRSVETVVCGSDLEALLLESREIARLHPRFNVQRQGSARRVWLWLPPDPPPSARGRPRARARLMLAAGPGPEGQLLGPFAAQRNALAARTLARALFGLDEARRSAPLPGYRALLEAAWRFLAGETEAGISAAQAALTAARAHRDFEAARRWERVLARALAYRPADLLLPADPAVARFAVVRPEGASVACTVIRAGRLEAAVRLQPEDDEWAAAARLLAATTPASGEDEVDLVLRWLGAQPATSRYLIPEKEDLALATLAEAIRAARVLSAGPRTAATQE